LALSACRLIAVDDVSSMAVLAVATGELILVGEGEEVPLTCGPFRVVSVLQGRLVVRPSVMGEGDFLEAWLRLVPAGSQEPPVFLTKQPDQEDELPASAPRNASFPRAEAPPSSRPEPSPP
jgi:hypothetical protein